MLAAVYSDVQQDDDEVHDDAAEQPDVNHLEIRRLWQSAGHLREASRQDYLNT